MYSTAYNEKRKYSSLSHLKLLYIHPKFASSDKVEMHDDHAGNTDQQNCEKIKIQDIVMVASTNEKHEPISMHRSKAIEVHHFRPPLTTLAKFNFQFWHLASSLARLLSVDVPDHADPDDGSAVREMDPQEMGARQQMTDMIMQKLERLLTEMARFSRLNDEDDKEVVE